MTWAEVVALARRLPGVEEQPSYGTPGLRANGRFLTRLRDDDASLVLHCPLDESDLLLETAPEELHRFLERRWRAVARKRDLAAWDAAQG